MASKSQHHLPTLQGRILTLKNKETSILFSLLPSVVKNHLPRIPSLRRSVPMRGLTGGSRVMISRLSTGTSTASGSGARTPELGYTSTMVLSGLETEEEVGGYFVETESEDDIMQRELKERQLLEVGDCKSGIGWKFANQGLNLLHLAASESTSLLRDQTFGNAAFARQLYLHALTYLLRGLPENLTIEEQLSLRSSLPSEIIEPVQFGLATTQQTPQPSTQEPSVLHRLLASTIVQLFIFFQFLLPYIRYLLSAAVTYERQHRISEKMVSSGFVLGRKGVQLTEKVAEMGDGRVGEILSHTTRWIVEGVVGGVHEGVGEGMVILGAVSSRAA